MSKKKSLSNEEFLRRVRDYLPMDAAVWNTNEGGNPCSCAISSGMEENRFYLFDAEALLAASHAIEELALEEANGSLVATMQHFKYFDPHRERYWQLAATLDRVRVIAKGRKRPPHNHLKFIPSNHAALAPIWAVLFEGAQIQAMLVGRQTNPAEVFSQKQFLAFYSFSAALIAHIRRDLEQILAGKSSRLAELERLIAIDRAAKQINALFDREQKAVGLAIRKLQTGGDRYQPRRFAADLKRSLSRLKQLNATLPELIHRGSQPLVA